MQRGRGTPFSKGHTPHNKTAVLNFTCEMCGEPFTRTTAYVRQVGYPRSCSRTCHNRRVAAENKATGRLRAERNGTWAGGKSPSYYRQHLANTCQRCGSDRFLLIHHIDYNRLNNPSDGSNWETLCKRCHQIEHDAIRNIRNGAASGR